MATIADRIAAIRADPESDEPRLALAEQWESEGDADRARLIRAQIERANLPWWQGKALDLELAERDLLAEHGERWRSELPPLDGVSWGPFRRGVIDQIAFANPGVFDQVGELCVAGTGACSVAIEWSFGERPKLGAVEGVRELTMLGPATEANDIPWLIKNPLLDSVRELDLVDSELRAGFPKLLRSKHGKRLRALRIPRHHLGTAGVNALIKASPPELVELELSAGSLDDAGGGRRVQPAIDAKGADALAMWPGLGKLERLDLGGNKLGAGGLRTLLGSPATAALRALSVRDIADGDWDTDDSLTAFQSGPSGELDELDIGDNDLDGVGALALANAGALARLKVLRCDKVKSSHFGLLAQAPWFNSLRVLCCDDTALPELLGRPPRSLHTLVVRSTGKLAESLDRVRELPALRALHLDGDELTDADLEQLTKIRALRGLELSALGAGPFKPVQS